MEIMKSIKGVKRLLTAMLVVLYINSATSQSVFTTTLTWTSGWCNICGPQTGNYACNPPWSGSGTWNNGMRTFVTAIPAGQVVTGVCVVVNKVNCGYTQLCLNINGTMIGCAPPTPPGNCSCGACWPETFCANFPCPNGMAGFINNGTNTLQLVSTPVNQPICVNNAIVTLTYQACCTQPTIVPVATPSALCSGGSTTLSASGAGIGGTYTWQPGNMVGPIQTVTPAVTTIYTVQGTNNMSCTGTSTIQVVVNPTPTITATPNPTNVCMGFSSTVTLAGANNYTTQPGNVVGNPIILTPLVPTTYTVTGSTLAGCVSTRTFQILVTPLPTVQPTNSGPVCVGQTLSMSVNAGVTYTWSGPNSFASNVQSPTIVNAQLVNSGVYTVFVTNAGCPGTNTMNVTIMPLPVITATSNAPVCVNQVLNLMGTGAVSYSWTGPNGYTANIQAPVINSAQLAHNGVYTIIGAGANGCTNIATHQVTVNPLPLMVTGNHVVCEGTPINHFANGALNYAWSGPGGFNSNQQNPIIPMASLAHQGAHVVVGTSAVGCTASAVSNVTVIPLVTPTIVCNTPCVGGTLSLQGYGGQSYTWSGPQGFAAVTQTPSINNVTLLNAGTYTLVTTIGFCTNVATYNATVNPLPTPTLTSNSPVCEKATLLISGNGGYSYVWNGPNSYSASGANLVITNAGGINVGNFTATATDANGCVNTAVIPVIVNPLPSIGALGSTLCANKTMTMAASGGTSYVWSGPLGFSASTPMISIPNITENASGNYTLTLTDANSCKSTSVMNVHVNPTPLLNTNANSPICAKESINLFANCPSGAQYLWAGPNGFFSLQQNPVLNDAGTDASGFYTVTVTDNIGCQSNAMVNMMIRALPTFSVTSDKRGGCIPVCINFGSASNANITSVMWEFGDGTTGSGNTAMKCYDNAGHYNVISTYTDVYGCKNTSYFSVDGYPIPMADFNFSPSKPLTNEQVDFTDASQNATIAQWTWLFNNLKTNQVILKQNTTMTYNDAGNYAAVLIVTSDKGCMDTIVKQITIGEDFGIYVPDAFSPNGDGINDIFQAKGFGITKYEMDIFDRWGEKVFHTTDFNVGWDGSFPKRKQDDIKQDVYIWHVKLTNIHGKGKELTGKVDVIR
jgi:gliding motility-associated-like protein